MAIMDSSRSILSKDLNDHMNTFNRLVHSAKFSDSIMQSARIITNCFKSTKRVILRGNGASAADSQHIAAEFSGKFLIDTPPNPSDRVQ